MTRIKKPRRPRRTEIAELRKTLAAGPSEWEGRLKGGRHLWIRYGAGRLRVGIGKTQPEAVQDTWDGRPDRTFFVGTAFDSALTTRDLLAELRERLNMHPAADADVNDPWEVQA